MTDELPQRLLKFCFVGALGILVQLGVLFALTIFKVDYLLATALAVEAAVIHNFLWHRRLTWSDRTRCGARDFLSSLLRFHFSNGLISLAGNLLLMRILVGIAQMPTIQGNLTAISICFVANFVASDQWVFRR